MKKHSSKDFDLAMQMGEAINDEFFNEVFNTPEELWAAVDTFLEKWEEENAEEIEELGTNVDRLKDKLEGLSDMEILNVKWIDQDEPLDPPIETSIEKFEEVADKYFSSYEVGGNVGDEVYARSSQTVMTSSGYIEGDVSFGVSGKVIEGGKVRIDKLWAESMPQAFGFEDDIFDMAYRLIDDLK